MWKRTNPGEARLLPGLFKERSDVNRAYLMELDTQCLLQNFYLEAGIILPGLQVVEDPEHANFHWGWEAPNCQLRGHFLGHFMSAAAVYAAEGDKLLRAKLEFIVDELERCQQLNGGEWVGSIPEKYFEILARDMDIWSPQYTMHKTIMGLLDAYRYAKLEKALDIVDHLADWYVRWTDEMLVRNPRTILRGEAGGMLEVWAALWELTGKEKYRTLVERYDNPAMFEELLAGRDPLTNNHANASIPPTHGAAVLYEMTGEERYRTIVEKFWTMAVEKRGYYSTGGANAGEFWIPPKMMGRYRGDRDQEFCTVYNMVRTAMYLYSWTGDVKYADYIERALYNGFLAQQNAETGLPTYFLPMKAGSRKKWGTKTRDFWCCYGTMVQGQTLYGSLIYTTDGDGLNVAQYIPSEYSFVHGESKITIVQDTDMKYYHSGALFDESDTSEISRWSLRFTLKSEKPVSMKLRLRRPSWLKGEPKLLLNGETASFEEENGYLILDRVWFDEELHVEFTPALRVESLPDRPDLGSIMEGPVVLAGLCDREMVLTGDKDHPETFLCLETEHTYDTFPWLQSTYRTCRQEENIELIPLYEVKEQAYTIYFPFRPPVGKPSGFIRC